MDHRHVVNKVVYLMGALQVCGKHVTVRMVGRINVDLPAWGADDLKSMLSYTARIMVSHDQ